MLAVLGSSTSEILQSYLESVLQSAVSMVGESPLSGQNMWPKGVRTKEDMHRFARLIVGPEASLEDYGRRLPGDMQDTFLLVSRDGCGQGTLLAELANCVPDMMEELTRHAVNNGNSQKPEVSYQTGAESLDSDFWYDSAQLSRSRCTCKINFGGQGNSKTRKFLNPDCQQWKTGKHFESVLLGALQKNSSQEIVRDNVYMRKAFHVLLNRIRHSANHRMGYHADDGSTYVPEDPITALNWGATGVLLIKSNDKGNSEEKVLVSRHGDVYMCGGLFQTKLVHAVPPMRDWPFILEKHRADLLPIEIKAMEEEMRSHHVDRVRHHIDVRWHTNHRDCTPHWKPHPQAAALSVDTMQQVAVASSVRGVQAKANSRDVSAMQIGGFFRLAPQAPTFADSPAERGAIRPPRERATIVKPLVGDTRTDPLQSSTSSPAAVTPGGLATVANASVQTEEDKRGELLQEVANECKVLMARCFSNADFLPEVLHMCYLAGSSSQMSSENRCLEQCGVFLKSMQSNLQRFDVLLGKLDAEGRQGYDAVVQKATSILHGMQSALADKHCLQEALDRVQVYGCSMFESRAGAKDVQIANTPWLRKFTITHEDCETLMQQIDHELLAERGDIVWRMPRQWTFSLTNTDGRQIDHVVSENKKLYVGFFDIGGLSDGTVHRLHLRAVPNKSTLRQSGEALALRLNDAIRRCTAHVRLIDYDHTRSDQHASVASQAYSLHVWAAPYSKRLEQLQKPKTGGQQKRAMDTDSNWYVENSQRPYKKRSRP